MPYHISVVNGNLPFNNSETWGVLALSVLEIVQGYKVLIMTK